MGKFGYGLLGVLAVGLVAGAAWLVFRDVRETALREPPEPHAERLARTALDALTPENGWLPALRQPLFAWDEDGEGWVREEEAGIALAESLPPSVPSHPGGNDPEPKPGDEEPPLMPVPRETDTNTGATSLEIADAPQGGSSGRSLAVPVRFPDPCTILRRPPGMTGIRYIAYDVYVPAEVQGYAGCLFFMKDKDGRWFQARSRTALMPGRWTTVTADLRGGSPTSSPWGTWAPGRRTKPARCGPLGSPSTATSPSKGAYTWTTSAAGCAPTVSPTACSAWS
ncbi:MAG: hypothetical protein M5U26_03425 [Planctomycetota bacterium]|nr:hypothetical protein [Planctomycetota bacterium]